MTRRNKRHFRSRSNGILKRRLFKLEAYPCHYCQVIFPTTTLSIEHLTPLCLGGNNSPENIALACIPCNNQKGKEAWELKRQLNQEVNQEKWGIKVESNSLEELCQQHNLSKEEAIEKWKLRKD